MTGSGNVKILEDGDRRVYLVGTAHVSSRSVEEVRQVIQEVRPDTVCVELDQNRFEAMTDEERWKKLDIFDVIKKKKVPFLIVSLALAAYQRRLGEKFGTEPGAELKAAIEEAESIDAELVLADRDIQITFRRIWRNTSFLGKLRLLWTLGNGFFDDEDVPEQQLEELKQEDTLAAMLGEFAEKLPQIKGPLIDERDQYLMSSIEDAPGKTIVAVVGAAHVPGMLENRNASIDREQLNVVPPPGRVGKTIKWVIPALILAAFSYGYFKHSGEGLREMILAWMLPNSIMAALLAMVGGARFLSILTAFVASPITSLNPTIAAGMVVGLVEAWLRRPTVEDCQRLREDAQTLRGFYRNRFTRVLLVSALASIGSAVGAWIGATWVVTLLR